MFEEIYEKDYLDFYDFSNCIGDLGEKWCTFKWHINNLQLYTKERIQSPVFTTRLLPEASWYLEVDISSPGNIETMELSLICMQNHTSLDVTVDLIYKIICEDEIKMSEKKTIQFNVTRTWVDRKGLNASFYKSKKSYIIVECKLRPNKSMIRGVCHFHLDKTLPINLRWLLQFGELFDTIIRVKAYRLKAHIAILHSRLPQLLVKCLSPYKEDEKHIINIIDLPVSAVKEMLKYAYTGQACLDLASVSVCKDLIISYSQNFWKNCCWEDNPFAETFFNYETDTLSWDLKDVFKQKHLDYQRIDLLQMVSNQILFLLIVVDSEEDGKWLVLTADVQGTETFKPTIVSCNAFLVNRESNEEFKLGETETFLQSNKKAGRMKLCSLLELQEFLNSFPITEDSLTLQTDFKICYGSYKSSIENIYDGKFDISLCTSCPQLSADMEYLCNSKKYSDIILENKDGAKCYAHRAILLARCPGAIRLEKKN